MHYNPRVDVGRFFIWLGKNVMELSEKSFVKSNFFLCAFCSNRYGFHNFGMDWDVDSDGIEEESSKEEWDILETTGNV